MKINILTSFLILIIIVLSDNEVLSQQDFNNFKTLKSIGSIPKDFSALTYEKINEDRNKKKGDLSKSKELIFLQGIHYGIDEILHSGMVCYGDDVSTYVGNIVDKLLKSEPELRSKLRFYTVKSNEANAFSTDQGIVFVTTGLISQLTSEAQLALVLSHEISHFTEKHVVQSFEYKIENKKNGSNIRDLSIYSKDHEIEADRKGLKWYNEAGYSIDEILPTFDVMMYSYLPFDEIEFPNTYFNSEFIFIPPTFFPDKKYEIKAVEDYDDSQSSHPNIKKRKEEIENEIDKYSNWGNHVFILGKEKFEYIRTICRFESVRSDIINSNYGDAIYSIFILEKEYPNSLFLQRMKAQAWLGLVQYKLDGSINETVDKNADLEGEIAAIHFFIKKLTKDGLLTLALRQIYDLKKANPQDIQIDAIYNHILIELSAAKQYKIESFSKKNFNDAANDFLNKNNKIITADTTTTKKTISKYDKIKNKKNADNPENFDSTKFYIYGIADILNDPNFTSLFKKHKDEFDVETKKEEDLEKLSYKDRNKILSKEKSEKLNIGAKELIIVEPMVFSYKHGKLDLIKSEKLKHNFSESIENTAHDLDLTTYTIDRDHLATKGTDIFNERNTLFNFMAQVSREDNFNIFPVDFELLEEIKNNYGTSKVLFTWVKHSYNPEISPYLIFASVFIYPILPIYIPSKILKGHSTEMNVIILDLEKGKVDIGTSYYFKDSPKKLHLGAHIFNIFKKLKTEKSVK